jgi:hypothetical protein
MFAGKTVNGEMRNGGLPFFYLMATESTKEHGNINALIAIFSCSFVDSVAISSIFIWLKGC